MVKVQGFYCVKLSVVYDIMSFFFKGYSLLVSHTKFISKHFNTFPFVKKENLPQICSISTELIAETGRLFLIWL